jgi:hypothetical protein
MPKNFLVFWNGIYPLLPQSTLYFFGRSLVLVFWSKQSPIPKQLFQVVDEKVLTTNVDATPEAPEIELKTGVMQQRK